MQKLPDVPDMKKERRMRKKGDIQAKGGGSFSFQQ